ncbi:reverse transcriptase domain-containing protein [Tanacetum coccineum]
MRTRNSKFPNNSNVIILRCRNRGRALNVVEPELRTIVEVAPMAKRTMEELLRAPTEGYGEAIILPKINADHFEIKTNLLQLVQANPFHGYERHINSFKRITSTLRFRDVPNDVIKLMMFPYSLEGVAKVCGFFQNQASTSGTLPSNTIPNPIDEIKRSQTRSGVAYGGPSIPTPPVSKKVSGTRNRETTDKKQSNFQGSTAHILPLVNPIPIPEPDVPKTLPKPNISYPSRYLRFDVSFTNALLLMPRFAPTIKSLLMNKEKFLKLAKIPLNENCSAMLLKKLPEKLGDPDKFLIPCYQSHFPGILFFKVGKFHFPTNFVVVDFEADPRVPLILGRSFLRTSHALIDVFEGELILRDGNEQIIVHVYGISKHPQKHVNELIKMVNDTCEDSLEGINNLSSGGTTPLFDFHLSLKFFKTSKSLFERFTDEPAPVCLPSPEDDDDEKEKQEVKNTAESTAKRQTLITPCLKNFKIIQKESIFHSNKMPQISSVSAITSVLPTINPKDYLIMGDPKGHLSTFG